MEQHSKESKSPGGNDWCFLFLTQMKAVLSQTQAENQTLKTELEVQKELNKNLKTQLNQSTRDNTELRMKLIKCQTVD